MRFSRIIIIVILIGIVFFIVGKVQAEMMPPRIAVNHETKECAEYNCGDECSDCILPEGWVTLGYAYQVSCPADYSVVEIDAVWKPLTNEFCCTPGHSGMPGDCEDVVINKSAKQCAFGSDVIESCGDLPFGWKKYGRECPYTWANEIQCTSMSSSWLYIGAAILGLICVGAVITFIIAGVLVWYKRRHKVTR